MQESIPTPHGWQLVYLAVASVLSSVGTLLVERIAKRKREPAEIRKIDAETHSLKVTTELSPVGITLETLREIQAVIQKAEQRREEWLQREEQMRSQIVFWRNKAEEMDGTIVDLQEQNGQMETRAKLHEYQIKKLKAILDFKNISYSELDQPKE